MKHRTHMVIPDTQVKPGVDTDHLEWAGKYAAERKPDVIIHLGDHWDMHGLSYYDKGKLSGRSQNYKDDIEAGNAAMDRFMAPIYKAANKTGWWPELHFCLGNHEQRIERYIDANAELDGTVGYQDFNLDDHHWTVHPFLALAEVDGIAYTHYLANPMSGKPLGGVMSTRLKNAGMSFTMGHQQTLDHCARYLANGKVHRGLVAGAFYQHDEAYKGIQGNRHWRGLIWKHEVDGLGCYDIMEVSMGYLRRKYGQ